MRSSSLASSCKSPRRIKLLGWITTLGKGCADASLLWTQADLMLIDGKLTQERSYYELLIEGIKSCMSDFAASLPKQNRP